MRKATDTRTVPCDVDTFWKVFFDPAYTKAFYLDEMGFTSVEILEQTETKRRMRVVPKLNMPGPVMKLLGDRFGYDEEGSFDRERSEWRWALKPTTLADKLTCEGVVRVEPAGEGKCRCINEVSMDARIFGVGKLVEGATEKDVVNAWNKEAPFRERWLKKLAG